MASCCRDLWRRRSHILAPLTSSVGGKGNALKWAKEHQNAFEETKRAISKETMLAFPHFAKPFHISADASDCQIGAVIVQNGKPLAFCSRKMNAAQKWHTTGEQELLSVAEAPKEFRTLLFGQQATAHADHKNILCGDLANNRIACWRLPAEERQPEIRHVADKGNAAAGELSQQIADAVDTNRVGIGGLLWPNPPLGLFPCVGVRQGLADPLMGELQRYQRARRPSRRLLGPRALRPPRGVGPQTQGESDRGTLLGPRRRPQGGGAQPARRRR